MRKTVALLALVLLVSGAFAGCTGTGAASDKPCIVATIFPEYDWVMNVLGEKAEDYDVTMLLDNGVDLHSFQATAADIMKISSCDMLIYVGGESDEWIEDALEEAVNKDMIVINLLETLGDAVKEEEIVEGMEEEEVEYDEHVWLSLRNAAVVVNALADAFADIDSENAKVYASNASSYVEKLNALDRAYSEAAAGAAQKTLLFADRFPFRYLTDDYGLDYYAAFVGCSAETEASFETVVFLSNKADVLGLKAILTIETSDGKLAKTINDNTSTADREIFVLDSMQSVTSKDIKDGASYLNIMEDNLEVLKKALR